MRNILFLLLAFWGLGTLNAQNIDDAVRYSTFNYGSTSRAIGAGSSFSALGADFSLIGSNPAGLAAYRKSEFVFDLGLGINKTTAQLEGSNTTAYEERNSDLYFNSVGFVFARRPISSAWRTANFSMGFNKLANFDQDFFYEGKTTGSITKSWLEDAQGLEGEDLNQFGSGLGYQSSAIFKEDGNPNWQSDFDGYENVGVNKTQVVNTSGYINEMQFALAGNYEEKLLAGISIGVPFVSFSKESTYEEKDPDNEIPYFNSLEYTERLSANGVGINAKLGLIYRMSQMLRFGFAVHTPSAIGLSEDFSSSILYDSDLVVNVDRQDSDDGYFEYNIVTPWRLSGGAGAIIGKSGFISAEVEWVDYSNNRFDFDSTNDDDIAYERDLNAYVSSELESALNLKVGAEFAHKILRLRGGLNVLGVPFVDGGDSRMVYSAGLGIRERRYFLDFAFQSSGYTEGFHPYQLSNASPFVKNDVAINNYSVTLGLKF